MRLTPTMLTLVVCYKYACFCYPFALVPTANMILIKSSFFLFSCFFVVMNFLHIYQSLTAVLAVYVLMACFFLLSGKCENQASSVTL